MSGLRSEVEARVLTVILDRPRARNALDRELILGLTELVRGVATDDAIDVVVLTGADPAFCAGLDVKQLEAEGRGFLRLASSPETSPFLAVRDCPKPVIAAVNGPAVAGGLELALACDIVVASERATFVDPHAKIGYVSVQGLSAALLQALGPSLARELSFSGNPLDAETAVRAGLASRVVPHHELLPAALELARDIAAVDQPTLRTIKEAYRRSLLALTEAPARWETDEGLRVP
jgi:enoyl-CoA hydratase/carnithine racemase